MKKINIIIIVQLLLFYGGQIYAGALQLPSIFSNHMVLQREKPIAIWGKADAGSKVMVKFQQEIFDCQTDANGKWMLYIPSKPAGGPYVLSVTSADECIELQDIYIGEVWFASGQSNMAWMLQDGVGPNTLKEIAEANYPLIRFFNTPHETNIIPTAKWERKDWDICKPETAKSFSAVAYFFAKEISQDQKVPVGIISSSWGATNIEAWMNAETLKTHKAYTEWVNNLDTDTLKWRKKVEESLENDRMREVIVAEANAGIKAKVYKTSYNDRDWATTSAPIRTDKMNLTNFWGVAWLRTTFEMPKTKTSLFLTGDIDIKALEIWLNGKKIKKSKTQGIELPAKWLKKKNVLSFKATIYWGSAHLGTEEQPLSICTKDSTLIVPLDNEWRYNAELERRAPGWQNYYNTNTVLYNAMVYPIMPYTIRGFLWYQGENNAGQAKRYRQLLPMLFTDWRVGFRQGNLPFLIVQLPNFMKKQPQPMESGWAEMREVQAKALLYPATGLAVTIDIGEEHYIHPQNKQHVSHRLYLQAQKLAYGRKDIIAMGPTFHSMNIEGNKIRISYLNVAQGLVVRGKELQGFTIAGNDKKYHWAKAEVQGKDVIVYSDEVDAPIAVRYAWSDNPNVNLYNSVGLPAAPFRTDVWEGITQE